VRSQDLGDASVGVGRAADQLEALRLGQAVHQQSPSPEGHRMPGQAVLVHEALPDEAVGDARAAEDDDPLRCRWAPWSGIRPPSPASQSMTPSRRAKPFIETDMWRISRRPSVITPPGSADA
jgi:hypothetical protein